MSRGLTVAMAAAIAGQTVRPFFLFECVLRSSTLRLWDGFGNLYWNADEYLGNGWFQGFSDIKEDNSISSNSVDVLLSGVPQALISLLLTEATHASRGKLWLGALDSTETTIILDPYLLFEGSLSAPRCDDTPDGSQVVLTFEDDLVMLQRNRELRYNHEAQQSIYPGDRGFEFVAKLQDWTGFWGNKKNVTPKPKKNTSTRKKVTQGNRR